MKNNIRTLREAKGLTQQQLAKKLKRTQPWIPKIERQTSMRERTAVRVAKALGCRVDALGLHIWR